MLKLIVRAWTNASDPVRIALVLAVAGLIAVGIIYGVDVRPFLLAGE